MKIILAANTAWYLYNFRLSLAVALRDRGDEVILISPKDPYAEKIISAGFRYIPIVMKRGQLDPFSDLRTLLEMKRIYSNENPDLIHQFTVKCVIYGSLAAKMTGHLRIVNSITGLGYAFTGNKFPKVILQFILKIFYQFSLMGTQLIFQNKDDLLEFKNMGVCSNTKANVIQGSGVDIVRFQPKPRKANIPLVMLAARMLKDKGVFEFVEAAKILHSRGVMVRMVLVGDPDTENPSSIPESTLESWNIQKHVEWWGWQDRMEEVYLQADIVCLPSYREGLPKSLIEAAACGLPIVTTDTQGCRDVVRDGINGFLVPVGDSLSLANSLEKLSGNPLLREKMGKASREIVESLFDVNLIVRQTLLVYSQI